MKEIIHLDRASLIRFNDNVQQQQKKRKIFRHSI